MYLKRKNITIGDKMKEFSDVTVVKKANVYFDGKVISRTVKFKDGTEKTLGFMQTGEYTFNTGVPEVMEIMSGRLEVLLPGTDAWKAVQAGESFSIQGNSRFTMKVTAAADYCCSYLK